jgi:hypothetical protein
LEFEFFFKKMNSGLLSTVHMQREQWRPSKKKKKKKKGKRKETDLQWKLGCDEEVRLVQAVAADGGCGRKKEEENLQGERTGGCCGCMVAVLASCGGDGG